MKKFLTIFLYLILFISCRNSPPPVSQVIQDENYSPDISRFADSYIIMERKGCPKNCPVDVVKIFGTGKVEYIGKENAPRQGKYEKEITPREVDHIFNEYECAGYFDYRQEYLCGREAETILLTWKHRGFEKTITDCEAAPEELKKLQSLCLNVIQSKDGWTRVYQE